MKRGFTLIELLVVIAIIGILSSVVLASLGTARERGQDASAQSSISAMRAEAELVYNGGYDDVCTASSTDRLFNAAVTAVNSSTSSCVDNDSGWHAWVTLSDDTTKYCADSSGFAGEAANAGTGNTYCDGTAW